MSDSFNPKEEPKEKEKEEGELSNEEMRDKLQEWLDWTFKCPLCGSDNNVMEVKELVKCTCAPGCPVRVAMIVGICLSCDNTFDGQIQSTMMKDKNSKNAKNNMSNQHGIVRRYRRHENN